MSETPTVTGEEARNTVVEPVDVELYIVTGTKNLRLPERFCKECNMFVNTVEKATEDMEAPVDIEVYSWWMRFPFALRHGGYHPPVMVVGGEFLCQGHNVPSEQEVSEAIRDVIERRCEE